jgi:transcriptional regulator with XRE-family HTH domain
MRIRTIRDLAAVMRGRRKTLGLTQADTAAAAGVSRKWMIDLENGRATGDLAAVLRVIDVLDLVLDISGARIVKLTGAAAEASSATATLDVTHPERVDDGPIDLDAVLDDYLDR